MNFFYEVIRDMSDLSSLLLFAKSHPVVSLTQKEVNVFIDYFQFIKRKIHETDNHFRKRLVGALLLAMFLDLSNVIQRLQQTTDRRQTRSEAIFTDFIRLVEDNFKSERRVSWYAEQLCITPKYLSESVKQISKRSPNEWIDNYVVLEIRLQLKNSNKSIKEISEYMHFPNQSFLGKYFKEHVGISPSAYRKS
jgi:AraC-like DNA-binding protein